MLTVLDRDTPQPKDRLPPFLPSHFEPTNFQEPPWLWFTLPELGFPLLRDEFLRPIHPDIEDYMRRHVSNDHDWEQVDGLLGSRLRGTYATNPGKDDSYPPYLGEGTTRDSTLAVPIA